MQQKEKMLHYFTYTQKRQIHTGGKQNGGYQAVGDGGGDYYLMNTEFQFGIMKSSGNGQY